MSTPTKPPSGTSASDTSAAEENTEDKHASGSRQRIRLQVDQRRAQLLDLGRELFSNYPYEDIGVEDIARAANVSKGLIYHYFSNKRHFFLETMREANREFLEATEVDQSIEDPVEQLRRSLDAYLDYVVRNAKGYSSMLRMGGADPEVNAIIEEGRETALQRLMANWGIEETKDRRAHTVLRGWLSFVEGAVLDWLDQGKMERTQLREVFVSMALAAHQQLTR